MPRLQPAQLGVEGLPGYCPGLSDNNAKVTAAVFAFVIPPLFM